MSADLVERVSGFSGLRVVVLGEAMLDCYLYGRADRLSSEAPVPMPRSSAARGSSRPT